MGKSSNCGDCCTTLGGEKFNAIGASFTPVNKTSLNDTGRHGASNTWARWSGRSKLNKGIASRSPYGTPATTKAKQNLQLSTLGGTSTHHRGLGIGPHGHGIGVIPANIGGPHGTKKTPTQVLKPTQTTRGSGVKQHLPGQEGRQAVPSPTGGFCWTCFGTWAAVAGVVFLGLLFSSR